jgi:uncharacterized membrane protein YhiD involved in acid resistance
MLLRSEQSSMTMPIEQAAINLAVALGLSAVIGFERQWRNRLAGLRTNTLVSLGAATFVIFAAVVPGDASPTRVAAQVVSGIGHRCSAVTNRHTPVSQIQHWFILP